MAGAQTVEQELVEQQLSPQKQAILDTAQELFTTEGYDGLSIRDLAEHCGLAKATIYHHFRDKEDLFFSVLQHELATMNQRIAAAAARESTPTAKLRAAVNAYYQLLLERRTGVMWGIHANADIKAQLKEFFRTHEDVLFDPWLRIVREGIDAGVFRPVDLRLSALSLLAMLNALVVYQTRLTDSANVTNVAEHVLSLFLQGIVRSDSAIHNSEIKPEIK